MDDTILPPNSSNAHIDYNECFEKLRVQLYDKHTKFLEQTKSISDHLLTSYKNNALPNVDDYNIVEYATYDYHIDENKDYNNNNDDNAYSDNAYSDNFNYDTDWLRIFSRLFYGKQVKLYELIHTLLNKIASIQLCFLHNKINRIARHASDMINLWSESLQQEEIHKNYIKCESSIKVYYKILSQIETEFANLGLINVLL